MSDSVPSLASIHTLVFDFDGVFTDNKVWVDQDGGEFVRCDRGDGLAFDLLRSAMRKQPASFEYFILSKEPNSVVLARAKKLGIVCHLGIKNKLQFITQYLSDRFPQEKNPFSGLVYLGNDLNDLPVMRRAGFSVAPADAHPVIRQVAHLTLPQRGGNGFIRAFIETILGINELSEENLDELISNC